MVTPVIDERQGVRKPDALLPSFRQHDLDQVLRVMVLLSRPFLSHHRLPQDGNGQYSLAVPVPDYNDFHTVLDVNRAYSMLWFNFSARGALLKQFLQG